MHDVYVAAITVGGSLLTGLLVAWATFRVSREQRKEQRRRDLEAALSGFLAALTKALALLLNMPEIDEQHPVVAFHAAVSRATDRLAPGRSWARAQREMVRTLGPQPHASWERVVDAASRIRVLVPGGRMEEVMDEAVEYLAQLAQDRSPAQVERWPEIRVRVLDAIAAVLDDSDLATVSRGIGIRVS